MPIKKKSAVATKSVPKKTAKSPVKPPKTWLRSMVIIGAKFGLSLVFALAIFTIYLDAKVQRVFEGQRWQVPAQLYGQIETLTVGEPLKLSQLAKKLKLNGYHKVTKVYSPGQYAQSAHRIIIYRRAFTFPQTQQYAPPAAVEYTIDVFQILNYPQLLANH